MAARCAPAGSAPAPRAGAGRAPPPRPRRPPSGRRRGWRAAPPPVRPAARRPRPPASAGTTAPRVAEQRATPWLSPCAAGGPPSTPASAPSRGTPTARTLPSADGSQNCPHAAWGTRRPDNATSATRPCATPWPSPEAHPGGGRALEAQIRTEHGRTRGDGHRATGLQPRHQAARRARPHLLRTRAEQHHVEPVDAGGEQVGPLRIGERCHRTCCRPVR